MLIFDLDNTLRNTDGDYPHTPFALDTDPTDQRNWVTWQNFVNENGKPIDHIVDLYHSLHSHFDTTIFTSSQFGTIQWLHRHNIRVPSVIRERSPENNLSGLEYKKSFIDTWQRNITLWVDDHKDTCDYVHSLKIPVVRVV